MNNYELTLILNPDLSSKFDEFQKKIEKTLSELNFEIKKLENIGRRQLAYSILNHNKGHYAIYQIEGLAEGALELESKLKYDTSVIRHLLLKIDLVSMEDSILMVESREAKKSTPEEIVVTPPKLKSEDKVVKEAAQKDSQDEVSEIKEAK